MSQIEKLKTRILTLPSDFTYMDTKKLLSHLGYKEYNKGKTSGSRVKFYREVDKCIILLHKPHPGDIVGKATLTDLVEQLKESGDLS